MQLAIPEMRITVLLLCNLPSAREMFSEMPWFDYISASRKSIFESRPAENRKPRGKKKAAWLKHMSKMSIFLRLLQRWTQRCSLPPLFSWWMQLQTWCTHVFRDYVLANSDSDERVCSLVSAASPQMFILIHCPIMESWASALWK